MRMCLRTPWTLMPIRDRILSESYVSSTTLHGRSLAFAACVAISMSSTWEAGSARMLTHVYRFVRKAVAFSLAVPPTFHPSG